MASERTSSQDREVVRKLWEKSIESDESRPLSLGGTKVPIQDLRSDFERFSKQRDFYLAGNEKWPCVVLDRVDASKLEYLPRFVPMDFAFLETRQSQVSHPRMQLRKEANLARGAGLPVSRQSPVRAQLGFLEGVIDQIISRIQLIKSGAAFTTSAAVTVTSSPTGVLAMYSVSHFFSTTLAFGKTNCTQSLAHGNYCFFRKSKRRTTALPIWNIPQHTQIPI
jgi:hypothetical protein